MDSTMKQKQTQKKEDGSNLQASCNNNVKKVLISVFIFTYPGG